MEILTKLTHRAYWWLDQLHGLFCVWQRSHSHVFKVEDHIFRLHQIAETLSDCRGTGHDAGVRHLMQAAFAIQKAERCRMAGGFCTEDDHAIDAACHILEAYAEGAEAPGCDVRFLQTYLGSAVPVATHRLPQMNDRVVVRGQGDEGEVIAIAKFPDDQNGQYEFEVEFPDGRLEILTASQLFVIGGAPASDPAQYEGAAR
jgi:hypothetical protein